MKQRTLTALRTAAVLAVLAIGTAPLSTAAPSDTDSAQDVVNSLQSSGHRVILNKTGSAPLSECTVTSIRPGREVAELKSSGDDLERVVNYTTIYVDARC